MAHTNLAPPASTAPRTAALLKGGGSQERGGFDSGDVETLAAAHVLADRLVVEQHHVAGGFGEAGPVSLVGAAGQALDLLSHHPAQLVGVRSPAKRTVQGQRL